MKGGESGSESQIWTWVSCGKNTAFAYGVHALPIALSWHHTFLCKQIFCVEYPTSKEGFWAVCVDVLVVASEMKKQKNV